MTHPLIVGHFEHANGLVRMGLPEEGYQVHSPVVARPLDVREVEAVLREVGGIQMTLATIPNDWHMRFEADGTLSCGCHTKNRIAIEFLRRVAERTGAEIWVDGGQRRLDSQQLLHEWLAREERARVLSERAKGAV